MEPLEIALIIIGIIIIIISCKLVDRTPKATTKAAGNPLSLENSLTEEEKEKLKDKVDEILSGVSEEVIIRSDDTLSKLSNEKIMAVNEFSDQILEKINRNHEQVIFLYNMLNDKEKELKSVVREIDSSKKQIQDITDVKTASDNPNETKKTKTNTPLQPAPLDNSSDMDLASEIDWKENQQESMDLDQMNSNNNSKILALYTEGFSIVDISRTLGLGQGEVKLVIDLFKGKK